MRPTKGRSKLLCRGLIVLVTQQISLSLHKLVTRARLLYSVLLLQRAYSTGEKWSKSHCAFSFISKRRHRLTGCHWKRISAMARVLSQDTFSSQSLENAGEDLTEISDPRQQWDLPSVARRGQWTCQVES